MGDIGSPTFGVCQLLIAEIISLAYETRVSWFQLKQPFDDAVKNIAHYKKELESCSDELRATAILKTATEYYDTAKQCVKDAMRACELSKSVYSHFYHKFTTADAEARYRISLLPTYDSD